MFYLVTLLSVTTNHWIVPLTLLALVTRSLDTTLLLTRISTSEGVDSWPRPTTKPPSCPKGPVPPSRNDVSSVEHTPTSTRYFPSNSSPVRSNDQSTRLPSVGSGIRTVSGTLDCGTSIGSGRHSRGTSTRSGSVTVSERPVENRKWSSSSTSSSFPFTNSGSKYLVTVLTRGSTRLTGCFGSSTSGRYWTRTSTNSGTGFCSRCDHCTSDNCFVTLSRGSTRWGNVPDHWCWGTWGSGLSPSGVYPSRSLRSTYDTGNVF